MKDDDGQRRRDEHGTRYEKQPRDITSMFHHCRHYQPNHCLPTTDNGRFILLSDTQVQ